MQSTYNGAEHEGIRTIKEPLILEARQFLSKNAPSSVSDQLQKLIPHANRNNIHDSGILERLITNTLTRSEREKIRGMAGIKPLSSKRKKKTLT